MKIHGSIHALLDRMEAKRKARVFASILKGWDGPQKTAEILADSFGVRSDVATITGGGLA